MPDYSNSIRDFGYLIRANSGKGTFWFGVPRKDRTFYVPGNRKTKKLFKSNKFINKMMRLGAEFDFETESIG